MFKTVGVLLVACFLTAETRNTLPVELVKSQDAASQPEKNKISYKLPDTAIPNEYKIELDVYLNETEVKKFIFDGKVKISFKLESTDTITLHSQDLNIKEVNLRLRKDFIYLNIPVNYANVRDDRNFLTITRKENKKFEAGIYDLIITYEGILSDSLRGFYRSHYTNDQGEEVWLAATHFEPLGARRAFPCFDEPAYKAKFSMEIKHHKNFTAIFNTKALMSTNDEYDKDRVTTVFTATPAMSTYLLAFVVSDFKTVQNAAKNFTVYARPNAVEFGKLALDKGEEILKKLEAFTGIPFETKIGKMDEIAIPQFGAGAMENWGLVTYKEQYLLYDENNATAAEKQSIVSTIAHEFAHQWFGDLVSPKWWKYLWLNEGFANFFESYITEQVESTWRSVEQSVVKAIQMTAFNADSSNNTHPINHDVESPKEISDMFDSISYQKGGAVIRMMQHHLTNEIFQKGLQKYLTDNKYNAADSDNLFKSIQDVVDKAKLKINVKEVMDAWVNKKGYPVVNVTRDYQTNTMNLTQERFFTYNASEEDKKNNLWQIPVNYATQKNPDFKNTTTKLLFTEAKATNISIEGADKDQWIILNKQQTGFYRVNYDEKNWKLIIDYLNSSKKDDIHPLNRAQLINDALAFVKEDLLDLQTLLRLTAVLKNETDYIAWYPAFETFSYLNSKLMNTEFHPLFKEYVVNATAALVKSVGFAATKEDDLIKKLHRVQTISLACSFEHSDCLNTTKVKLAAWLEDEKSIPKDLKQATLCHGLRNASHGLWEQVFNKSKNNKDVIEMRYMTTALSCVNEPKILEWYLHYSLSNETAAYLQSAILNVLGNSEIGVDIALDFLGPNIFKIHWKLENKNALLNIINKIGQKVTTKEQLQKLKALQGLNVLIPDSLIDEAVNNAEENLKWLEKHNATLTAQFTKTKSSKGGAGAITASIGLIASLLVILISNNS